MSFTDRATDVEKAQAWTQLMKSTKNTDDAIMDAYNWLENQVKIRECGGETVNA